MKSKDEYPQWQTNAIIIIAICNLLTMILSIVRMAMH